MNYDDFRTELKKAGLSIRSFAKLLQMNPNSITNCRSLGDVPRHLAVIATLIRLLYENKVDYASSIRRMEIKPSAPRGRSIGT